MDDLTQTIDRINELLDRTDTETTNTSMRIPRSLKEAAELAVSKLGAATSTTTLANAALRMTLEAIAVQAALDFHYTVHPHARPTLGDLAVAAAELDGHPLASDPERLRQAAVELIARHPEADADDVLLWAEARMFV